MLRYFKRVDGEGNTISVQGTSGGNITLSELIEITKEECDAYIATLEE